MERLSVLDLRAVTAVDEIGARVVAGCRRARLVFVRTNARLGVCPEFWDEALFEHARRVAVDEDVATGKPTGRLWSTVDFNPSLQNSFRHSCSAQPLHTDGSYASEAPDIVFMVCRRPAQKNGATLFLDGPDLVRALESQQPDLLERLVTEEITFAKGETAVESPVIAFSADGPILRWNYYALHPRLHPAALSVADAFRAFLQDMAGRLPLHAIRLEPGGAVFFHDNRLLHGRESFSADSSGGRFLWKGGLNL